MSKLIPINISDAKVDALNFNYDTDTGIPTFEVNVCLIDSYGRRITSINIGNRGWGTHGDCEASAKLFELAAKLRLELDNLVTIHMNKQNKTLEVKNV